MITPGLLTQRLRLYERQDDGADGFARPVYVFTREVWGRLDVTGGNQTYPGAPMTHGENRDQATATVDIGIDVPVFGLLRDVTAGDTDDLPLYAIRSVITLRQLREQRITCEAVTPDAYASFTIYDPVDVLDGTHLITPR